MRHLVFSSVKQLLDHLVKSYHAPEKREEMDENELVREKYETGKNEFVIEKLRNIVENELVKKSEEMYENELVTEKLENL